MSKKKKLTYTEYFRAVTQVAGTSFRIAPGAAMVRIADSIIQALLPIATTYFAAKTTSALADAYSGNEQASQQIFFYMGMTALISVTMLLWSSVSNYVSQITRYKVESAVEDMMLSHFTSLAFHMYDDKEVMDLHAKALRFSYYFSYIFNSLGGMFSAIIGAIVAMISLVSVNWWVPLIILVTIIPGIVIQLRLARRQAQHWEGNITLRRRKGNMGWMLQESRYIAEMRVYGVAKYLIKLHASLRDQDEKERLKFEGSVIWKQLLVDVLQSAVELVILVWTVLEIIHRNLPVGQFLFVQQLVGRAMNEANSLARQLGNIDQDLANIIDYQKFMELETQPQTGMRLHDAPNQISLQHVSFMYPKTAAKVLDDISLTIQAGQHIAIVGENGAGKSTLIKLILGLYTPTKGTVLVDGISLAKISIESWHAQIALLWQDFVSYYFATIKENIVLGNVAKPVDNERYLQALRDGEFEKIVSKLEHGDETFIERWMAEDNDEATATELSGGQYQRLALARNFYRNSPIVILDEPTSAIDALAEARIFKHLFQQKEKTVITISHRYTTIEKADIIYMLKDGRVVESGTADELISNKSEFYEMFKEQLK
jgi:ATP-binding cassette subfamily B protein/ATP-binding cassette subfamily C protein